MREDRRPPILDVRDARAFRRGHLPGAVRLDEERVFEEPYLLPPRHRRFFVVGRDAAHASAVARRLREAGWAGAEPLPPYASSVAGTEAEPRRQSEVSDAIAADATHVPGMDSPSTEGSEFVSSREDAWVARGHLWEPAPFLEEVEPLLPVGGRAIDLACGSGRNAVYLGLQRLHRSSAREIQPHSRGGADDMVLGVDILPDAIEQARRLRRAAGCPARTVRFRCADLTDDATVGSILRPQRYSVVMCFRYLDRALLPHIGTALAPGGMVVYETFLVKQREVHGKPSNPAFLLEPGELRQAFGDLEILRYREGEDATGNFTASLLARRQHAHR
jgi:SAM-dependent methyltransferase/rhodanese-related sulfurtransferase